MGRAGEREQVAVGAPARAVQRTAQRQLLVEAVGLAVEPHLAVAQIRVLEVAVEAPLDGDGAALALELDDVEKLVEPVLAHQEPLDADLGGQVVDDVRVGLVQEPVGPLHEGVLVLVVRVRQHLQVQQQIGLEAGQVVLALALQVQLGAPFGEEAADRLDGGHAVAQVGQFGVALGDGGGGAALTAAPEVHDVGEDIDLGGPEVGEHVDPGVLVEDPLGELDVVVVPEGPPEQLVPHGPVVDERLVAGDVGAAAVLLHRPLVQGRLPLLGGVHHLHVARDEVRVGLVQGADQELVRVLGNDVVAVDEGEELTVRMHRAQSGVAGVAGTVGLLTDEPEPRVVGAELGRDPGRVVGGAVVDEDHLEVAERLARDGLQALAEVRLNILKRDNDTQTGSTHLPTLLPRHIAQRAARRTVFGALPLLGAPTRRFPSPWRHPPLRPRQSPPAQGSQVLHILCVSFGWSTFTKCAAYLSKTAQPGVFCPFHPHICRHGDRASPAPSCLAVTGRPSRPNKATTTRPRPSLARAGAP